MNYLAVVRLNSRREFGIELPDFPELRLACASVGEAQRAAERAIREAVDQVVQKGDEPPTPTTKQELEGCPEYRSTFLFRVEVDASARG